MPQPLYAVLYEVTLNFGALKKPPFSNGYDMLISAGQPHDFMHIFPSHVHSDKHPPFTIVYHFRESILRL